jgi:hypothetical protein
LTSSVKTYNKAVASFGSRLLPQVRSLETYIRTEGDRVLAEPKEVEEQVRSLASGESDPGYTNGEDMSMENSEEGGLT